MLAYPAGYFHKGPLKGHDLPVEISVAFGLEQSEVELGPRIAESLTKVVQAIKPSVKEEITEHLVTSGIGSIHFIFADMDSESPFAFATAVTDGPSGGATVYTVCITRKFHMHEYPALSLNVMLSCAFARLLLDARGLEGQEKGLDDLQRWLPEMGCSIPVDYADGVISMRPKGQLWSEPMPNLLQASGDRANAVRVQVLFEAPAHRSFVHRVVREALEAIPDALKLEISSALRSRYPGGVQIGFLNAGTLASVQDETIRATNPRESIGAAKLIMINRRIPATQNSLVDAKALIQLSVVVLSMQINGEVLEDLTQQSLPDLIAAASTRGVLIDADFVARHSGDQ